MLYLIHCSQANLVFLVLASTLLDRSQVLRANHQPTTSKLFGMARDQVEKLQRPDTSEKENGWSKGLMVNRRLLNGTKLSKYIRPGPNFALCC